MANEQAAGKDNILAFLVQATNKHDLSIDITLNVNGAIVTGTIVSAKEYFVSLSETFEDGSDVAQQLSEKFAQAGESIDSEDGGEASFIHLKDAKVYCGSSKPSPSKGSALWRGALSDINGFYLDDFSDSGEKEDEEESDDSDYQTLKDKNSKLTDRIGKLEGMLTKLSRDSDNENEDDEESEESKEEKESAKKQDTGEDEAKDDGDKEKSEKKRSGTKSSSAKTKKKTTSSKQTAKAE